MTHIEEALALLADPCTDGRFFQRALKALALVTQCRWAAFGRPSETLGKAEVVAFCDLNHSVPGFEFNQDGAPANISINRGILILICFMLKICRLAFLTFNSSKIWAQTAIKPSLFLMMMVILSVIFWLWTHCHKLKV